MRPGPSGSGCTDSRGRRPCVRSALPGPPPHPPLALPTASWADPSGEAELLRPFQHLLATTTPPRIRRRGEAGLRGWKVVLDCLVIGRSKGIVLRDFGGLQKILANSTSIEVPDDPLEVYSFLNFRFHTVI